MARPHARQTAGIAIAGLVERPRVAEIHGSRRLRLRLVELANRDVVDATPTVEPLATSDGRTARHAG